MKMGKEHNLGNHVVFWFWVFLLKDWRKDQSQNKIHCSKQQNFLFLGPYFLSLAILQTEDERTKLKNNEWSFIADDIPFSQILVTATSQNIRHFLYTSVWNINDWLLRVKSPEGFWHYTEAALQKSSYKNVFWNYAANLQENIHAEVLCCNIHEAAKQRYRNSTSAWIFSCKFVPYFKSTFS